MDEITDNVCAIANRSKRFVISGKDELKNLIGMLRRRDFSGNKGALLKNSAFQFSSSIASKAGGLIFTILIARILMPEMFGLYSLSLSTILIFASVSDLGVSASIILFVSNALGKGNLKKAGAYFGYLSKLKGIFLIVSAAAIILGAKILANNYYHKPIFLALLAGAFYILFSGAISLFDSLFQAHNSFKQNFLKEVIFQCLRIIIVPLAAVYAVRNSSVEAGLGIIFIAISLAYLLTLVFMVSVAYSKLKMLRAEKKPLDKVQRIKINKFLWLMSTTVLSGMFIGYVDTVMLGRFVQAEYIGFYQAALSVASSLTVLIPISGAIFPIFSRLRKESLERAFRKSTKITLMLSAIIYIIALLLAPIAINVVYGKSYQDSIVLMQVLSAIVLFMPLSGVYDSYFVSRGKPHLIAKFLIFSTVINIIFNFAFISILLKYSQYWAAIGSASAVVITRGCYLLMQIYQKRKLTKSESMDR